MVAYAIRHTVIFRTVIETLLLANQIPHAFSKSYSINCN